MKPKAQSTLFKFLLWAFLVLVLTPIIALLTFSGSGESIDPDLFLLAKLNTLGLALGVLFFTTVIGTVFSYIHCFYNYPLKRLFHSLMLLPLAFPAYVLAFIYLGALGPSQMISSFVEIQGELWFLVLVLTLALTPYIYYFTSLGFRHLTQSEVETEVLLSGGRWKFFKSNTLPKILPFLVSGQILVTFEALSDFGAASVINVPVITTMIYKLWFDLFSFSGAVQLSLKYSLVVLGILVFEISLKKRGSGNESTHRDPVVGVELGLIAKSLVTFFLCAFVLIAFIWPTLQIALWSASGSDWTLWETTFWSTGKTVLLGGSVGFLVVLAASFLQIFLREKGESAHYWNILSTIGYSLPGSILAVSTYSLLLKMTDNLTSSVLIAALVVSLSYKFLTVAMRPIGEAARCLPGELIETSSILSVPLFRKLRLFFFPYLKESCVVALLLVMIEVMKEMPLTLMLSPSEFQTLSIHIFNFTSEGEWEKAALPSLMLLIVGILSVTMINLRKQSQ